MRREMVLGLVLIVVVVVAVVYFTRARVSLPIAGGSRPSWARTGFTAEYSIAGTTYRYGFALNNSRGLMCLMYRPYGGIAVETPRSVQDVWVLDVRTFNVSSGYSFYFPYTPTPEGIKKAIEADPDVVQVLEVSETGTEKIKAPYGPVDAKVFKARVRTKSAEYEWLLYIDPSKSLLIYAKTRVLGFTATINLLKLNVTVIGARAYIENGKTIIHLVNCMDRPINITLMFYHGQLWWEEKLGRLNNPAFSKTLLLAPGQSAKITIPFVPYHERPFHTLGFIESLITINGRTFMGLISYKP